MKKVYYYKDEINDDFAGTNIDRKELPVDYSYFSRNPIRKFFGFVLYRLIVTPLVFLFQKTVYHQTIKNKKVLKGYRKNGYFLYANHTLTVGDAFTPTLVTFPKKAYILVNPDAVSLPVAGKAVEMFGGVPLPTQRKGLRPFHDAVLKHAEKKHCVVVYPEAHIWPYYTKIRPFKDVSFRYPAEADKPVFSFTTTYQKRRFLPFPKVTVYVDGPFFPDKNLSVKENQRTLRDAVYETMKQRSELSTYEHREYIKTANIPVAASAKEPAPAAGAFRPGFGAVPAPQFSVCPEPEFDSAVAFPTFSGEEEELEQLAEAAV